MVVEESLQQIELVVILIVELLALLGLEEIVGLVLVAVLHRILLELLLTQSLKFENDAVLKFELSTLESLQSLSEVFDIDVP